jgi:hypothetical protein
VKRFIALVLAIGFLAAVSLTAGVGCDNKGKETPKSTDTKTSKPAEASKPADSKPADMPKVDGDKKAPEGDKKAPEGDKKDK